MKTSLLPILIALVTIFLPCQSLAWHIPDRHNNQILNVHNDKVLNIYDAQITQIKPESNDKPAKKVNKQLESISLKGCPII